MICLLSLFVFSSDEHRSDGISIAGQQSHVGASLLFLFLQYDDASFTNLTGCFIAVSSGLGHQIESENIFSTRQNWRTVKYLNYLSIKLFILSTLFCVSISTSQHCGFIEFYCQDLQAGLLRLLHAAHWPLIVLL